MLVSKTKQKVCLVDFDGVILRNPTIHHLVKKRVVKYVGSVVKTNCTHTSDKLNQYLYDQYGHTLIGLQQVFGKDAAGSLSDFNNFVYDNLFLDKTDYFESRKEIRQWNMFVSNMKNHNIPVYIFSNAPKEWCVAFLGENQDVGYVYDHIPYDAYHLKPGSRVFERVNELFGNNHIYFIDDKPCNFVHTYQNGQWTNIHFNDKTFIDCSDRVCCA